MAKDTIIIQQHIRTSVKRVFDAYTTPADLMCWHNAGDGWSTPYAEVDLKVGGLLKIAYADPEGTVVFELVGEYTEIRVPEKIVYVLGTVEPEKQDAREVCIELCEQDGGTMVTVEFDIEHTNSKELQRQGWSQHLINLKKYLEE